MYFSYFYHKMQYIKKNQTALQNFFFLCRFQYSDADLLYLKGNTVYNAYILLKYII